MGKAARGWWPELRHAARALSRDPRFTPFAVGTLAVCIGANVAVYSAVEAILLRPLPYRDADRLVMLWSEWTERDISRMSHSGGDFRTYQREAESFAGIAAVGSGIQNLTGGERPVQVTSAWVSRNFFDLLGVEPVLGRSFRLDEPPSSVLLGHGVWRRSFGGDPGIVGRPVRLDGHAYTVVGVLPPGFRLHLAPDAGIATAIDVWRPPDEAGDPGRWVVQDPQSSTLRLIGRLAPGVTVRQAEDELRRLAERLRERFPGHAEVGFDVAVRPLHEEVVGEVRPRLLVLQGAVGLVLLLGCVNVANLSLARAHRRRREILVRLAVGARRADLLRQFLAESLLLAAAGGTLGLALASAALGAVGGGVPGFPRADGLGLHAGSPGFAAGVTLLAAVLAGCWPALRASRFRIAGGLRLRGGEDGFRRGLVVVQVALAAMLLSGAFAATREFLRLQRLDPGLRTENVLSFGINLPGTAYEAPVETHGVLAELSGRLEAEPGVAAAAAVWPLPFEGQLWAGPYRTAEQAQADAPVLADYRLAGPGLLEALGIRILEGRALDESDTTAILVDRAFVERNWPGGSGLGRTVTLDPGGGFVELQVVGVVETVRHPALRTYAGHTVYLPTRAFSWSDFEIFVVVRTTREPAAVWGIVRGVVSSVDPELPLGKTRTLEGYVDERLDPARWAGIGIGGFAVIALGLALLGVYGLLASSIALRRREIGIRQALGAAPGAVVGRVAGQGMGLVAAGAGAGALGTLLLGELLRRTVPEIAPPGPGTLAAAIGGLLAVGAVACWTAARAAAAVDPAETLRSA